MKIKKITASLLIGMLLLLSQPTEAQAVYMENAEQAVGEVYLGGQTVGVAMYLEGLLVTDTAAVERSDGVFITPALEAGIKKSDSILSADGVTLYDISNLDAVLDASGGEKINLTVKRNEKEFQTSITPVFNGEGYRLGLYLRDSAAGLGTITYVDAKTNNFASLGHSICDNDTGATLRVRSGRIVECEITGIEKAQRSRAGELKGIFGVSAAVLGTVTENTEYGLKGTVGENFEKGSLIEVGNKESVHTGQAEIYSDFETGEVKAYSVEITYFNKQTSPGEKSLMFKVTDEALIEKTGGIVQGLSGSPIVQDGRLIGAVTHVMLSDPTRGYGLYIEWMM